MASLTGTQIANTYKQLLQVGSGNVGLGGTLQTVQDGDAANSPLQLSTNAVNINGAFQLSGVTLTASASTLNAVADLTGATGLVAVSAGNVYGRTLVAGTGIIIGNANGTEGNPTIAMVTATTSGSYKGPNDIEVNAVGQIVSISPAVSVSVATIKSAAFEGGTFVGSTGGFSSNVSIGDDLVVRGDATLQRITVSAVALTRLSATSGEFSGTVSAGFFAGDGRFLTNVPLPSSSGTMQKLTSGTGINLTIDGVVSTTIATSGTVNLNANQSFGIVSATNIDADELLMAGVSAANVTEVAAVSVLTSVNLAAITSINSVIGDGTGFVTDAELAAVSATLATSIGNSNTNIAAVSVLTSVNLAAITSINSVIGDGTGFVTDAELAATSVALATSIGNSNTRITSVSDFAVALSATLATSIGNSNTNITTNINAITSINSVLGNGSGFATDAELAATSVALATSIGNSNTTIAAVSVLTSVNLAAITSITAINTQDVTLTGTPDYITISNQVITRNQIDLTADVTGNLPVGNLNAGTGASGSSFWRGDGVWATPSGSGDVVGPASSTDNAIVRFDSTTGKLLQNSTVTISDVGAIAAASLTLTTDLAVAEGGTGAGTFAANGILYGNGTGAIGATAVGTSGHILTSNGSGVAPTFQAAAAGGATDIDGLSDGFTSGTNALYLGTDVGNSNTAGNTAVGQQSLQSITGATGGVVAFGWKAGKANAGGYWNTFIGATAADGVTTGIKNVLMGYDVSKTLTTGSQNVIIGSQAAENLSTGGSNTIIGENAGTATATNANCIIIGKSAASSSNSVANEITLGNTTVDKFRIPGINFIIKDSTATEDYVLTVDASGEAGWEAAAAGGATDINGLSDALTNSSGVTIGLGTGALAADDGSTNKNTAVGFEALNDVTSGSLNVGLGHQAGDQITTASNSVALGAGSMGAVTTAGSNVAIGSRAMETGTGSNNTYVGKSSGEGGAVAAAIGNAALGYSSLEKITTGSSNVAVGYQAGLNISTGGSNTMLGGNAGDAVTTGSNNTVIGQTAAASSATVSNEITLGNASVTSFRIPGVGFYNLNGNVGIGTASPSQKLTVEGTDARIYLTGANTDINMTGTADGQLSLDGNGFGFGIALNSSGANLYTNSASRDLIFGTDETERMRIDGAGLVGIGTSSPSNFLTVSSATQYKGYALTNGTNTVAELLGFAAGNDSGGLKLYSGGVAKAEVQAAGITYFNGGNVGIGTASPAKQLSITKSALATINTLTDGATITPDFDAGQNFSVTLAGNRTLANPTNIDAGQTGSIFITQDGTGSRTLSFGSYWDFPGGTAPTLSTAAASVDRIDYIVRTGTSIHAVATLNLS